MGADADGGNAAIVALARVAAPHALAIFGVSLLLVVAATCIAWWVRHRLIVLPGHVATPPPWLLGLRLALGFGAIVAGAWGFAEIAEALHAQAALGAADELITQGVRDVPLVALHFFAAVTRLGDVATMTVLCIAVAIGLVVLRRRWLAFAWVVAIAGNGLLNQTLKHVFERVRPLHDDGLVLAHGFSFPSGHSSGAVVGYGMLAYVATRLLPPRWHLTIWIAALVLAFTIGASRMFLRVHFASDVLAGFASGSAWLAVCIASIVLGRWYRARRA
ncbi:phosphatase PAP2 family protein [Rhizobacter fulvus]|jgi:undecaprenyl-diphosphatase